MLEPSLPQFFTATCLEWQTLLQQDKYKEFILQDLQWLVNHYWIKLYAFVIMPNHVHYIWEAHPSLNYSKVKGGHLRNTAQKIKHILLQEAEEELLNKFLVNAADRQYQIWERNPKSKELYTPQVIYQKLDYIHANPVKANLCQGPADYFYSSAAFYETGDDPFNMLTHIGEIGVWDNNKKPILVKSQYF